MVVDCLSLLAIRGALSRWGEEGSKKVDLIKDEGRSESVGGSQDGRDLVFSIKTA